MAIISLASLLAAGISLVTNFRLLVNSMANVRAPSAEEPLVTSTYYVKGHDFILPTKPDTCLQKACSSAGVGTSPRLIASTGAHDSLDNQRVMAATAQAGTSMDRSLGERHAGASIPSSTHPKRSITIQRLSCMTPSPPRFIRWMLTRGGERFRPIDICRPGWQRLAVQYVEGCDVTDNDETGEPWSPCPTANKFQAPYVSASSWPGETDIVDERELLLPLQVGLNLVSHRPCMKHTFDSDFAPEQLKAFERLVAKRIRASRLNSMPPLKQAIHNSLARVVDLKVAKRERTGTSKRSRNHTRGSPNASSFKLDDGQRVRRTRPTVRPLDLDITRASHPPTDSPPESPGPTTPVDGSSLDPVGLGEICIVGDETMPGEPAHKDGVGRTPSRGRLVARSKRRC
ncbi:hypothetical protein FRC10_011620 [Ceratobasidium sp. 414]|nr:hypothetical protein FRC10_011620 [Ceratobasidium sp. 414]